MTTVLSSARTELRNRNKLFDVFLGFDFLPAEPVIDMGIDFFLYREADEIFFAVQQKAIWTVERKYHSRNIWMVFGDDYDSGRQHWYLAPHDLMVQTALRDYGHNPTMKKPVSGKWETTMSNKLKSEFENFKLPDFLTGLNASLFKELTQKSKVDWPQQ